MIASARTVIPSDLCRASGAIFAGPDSESAYIARRGWPRISSTMSQCSDFDSVPQARVVLRKVMPGKLSADRRVVKSEYTDDQTKVPGIRLRERTAIGAGRVPDKPSIRGIR